VLWLANVIFEYLHKYTLIIHQRGVSLACVWINGIWGFCSGVSVSIISVSMWYLSHQWVLCNMVIVSWTAIISVGPILPLGYGNNTDYSYKGDQSFCFMLTTHNIEGKITSLWLADDGGLFFFIEGTITWVHAGSFSSRILPSKL
jgi:hypothetical protein